MVAAQTHANLTPRSSIGCYTDIFLGLRRGEGKGNFIAKACRSNTEAERWPAPGRAAAQRPTRNPTQSMASLRPNALFVETMFGDSKEILLMVRIMVLMPGEQTLYNLQLELTNLLSQFVQDRENGEQ